MVWNSVPTQNGQPANLVLGKPNFTTFVETDLTQGDPTSATAANLLNPVSVTSDGIRLYVSDLAHNRVLIWNSIPTQNGQPADIALGQPDIVSTTDRNAQTANNSKFIARPVARMRTATIFFRARAQRHSIFHVLSAAILLSGPNNSIISVVILDLWDNGNIPQLAALSVVLAIGVAVLGVVFMRLSTRHSFST